MIMGLSANAFKFQLSPMHSMERKNRMWGNEIWSYENCNILWKRAEKVKEA